MSIGLIPGRTMRRRYVRPHGWPLSRLQHLIAAITGRDRCELCNGKHPSWRCGLLAHEWYLGAIAGAEYVDSDLAYDIRRWYARPMHGREPTPPTLLKFLLAAEKASKG